nr:1-phosphatidylinositol 3-phosphate 5-kinase fab1 [Quercus suber]
MALGPPSPSASSTLLPFLVNTRSRRGSIASITSRGELDKTTLAQALDQIHESASKSETLTSFHDFDGGEQRESTTELVSNGVSGIYNRLRQSVTYGTANKASDRRSKSNVSKDLPDTASTQSSITQSRTGSGLGSKNKSVLDNASSSTASPGSSPMVASFTGDNVLDAQRPVSGVVERTDANLQDYVANSRPDEIITSTENHSRTDVDLGGIKWSENVSNEGHPSGLAQDLQHQEVETGDGSRSRRGLSSSNIEVSPSIDSASTKISDRVPSTAHLNLKGTDMKLPPLLGQTKQSSSPHPIQRPAMQHVGISHLPGYDLSRASSTTDGGDLPSLSSPRKAVVHRSSVGISPNLNTALQRRRTGVKATASVAPPSVAPSPKTRIPVHLRRRVISKEFWMKDENAKDCFSCGQSFSTFRRKHHCRTCGQIFDSNCTTLVAGRPFGQPGTLRLCKPCEAMIYGSDDESTLFSDDEEDIERAFMNRRESSNMDEDIRLQMDGTAHTTNPGALGMATPSIGIPASRRNRESKRRSAVIEFDAQPTLVRPTSSHSLISLSRRPRSSSHRRFNARYHNIRSLRPNVDERVPFQPETEVDRESKTKLPAFHHDNIIDPDLAAFLSDEGSDEDETPDILSTMEQDASPGERDRLGLGYLLHSAIKRSRSKPRDRTTTVTGWRGAKEDDVGSPANRNLAKSRNRNISVSNISLSHPPLRWGKNNSKVAENENVFGDHQSINHDTLGMNGVRSSTLLSVSHDPVVELHPASLKHVQKLLAQLLHDAKIKCPSVWEKALLPILLECTDDVKPDVERGDDMDIRHYVKLKKVPGGKPCDTSYVSGVAFSKNLASKSMARSIVNPRIAIVTFSIEYARHQSHFMSLDPVIAQEREYLDNLVGRIAALRPDVLLVQRNVSGLALRLLEHAGITVAYNIKQSVLAAVARCTQTSMIKSVDKLAIDPSHLGHCQNFSVKTYAFHGVRKSYIYLSDCAPELGCTIILRGADTKTLRKIKRVTEFMCYVVYNLKLETYFMRDENAEIPSAVRNDESLNETTPSTTLMASHSEDEVMSKYAQMEADCRSRILSVSPFVAFMQPYLLTQLRVQEQKLAKHKMLRDQYAAADGENDDEISEKNRDLSDRFELVRPEMVDTPASIKQPKTVREYLHAVHDAQFDKTMHTYETQRRLWDSFMAGSDGPFDPFSHQSIVVLYSTVSSITSAPCSGPELVSMSYYAGYGNVEPGCAEDCTLGQYIEELCLGCNSICEACNKKMIDHHRQYVHGYGQLSISIQQHSSQSRHFPDRIAMWSVCRVCNEETRSTQMSYDTWKYSFAKYLELSFWSRPLHPEKGCCRHDMHKDFLRCFSLNELTVRIQYDRIEIYDVVVPRATITWRVETDLTVKNEQFTNFMGRLNAFTESVKKRLNSINVDTLEEKKATEAHDKLDELHRRADEDHRNLRNKLREKYSSSRYYELIPLNRALRFMDEKAIEWDEAFNSFERDYFPSETDIRRLATLQLKSMFLESQPAPNTEPTTASDDENGTEMKLLSSNRVQLSSGNDDMDDHKAHDVLFSTIEEHRASHDDGSGTHDPGHGELSDAVDSSPTRRMSPRRQQEHAVERQDVKHLDLAIVSKPTGEQVLNDGLGTVEHAVSPEAATLRTGSIGDDMVGDHSLTAEPKPLSSGLLERIEQIRNTRPSSYFDRNSHDSKIPRPVENKKRDRSPVPPPLLRAKSQPAQLSHRSEDLDREPSVDAFAAEETQQSPAPHPVDVRLHERLGIYRLTDKVGKVTASLIPRPIQDEAKTTSVSALAKHFEEMSREFEKERLKERRQRAMRSRQARANPLASSRPIVEVYRNATEAVGERAAQPLTGESGFDDHNGELNSQPVTQAMDHAETRYRATQTPSSDDQGKSVPYETASLNQQPEMEEDEDSDMDGQTVHSRETSDPTISDSVSSTLAPPSFPLDLETHPELSIPEYKKNAWFKYLADFWSKRSASGWSPLEYPLHGAEHVFEDSDIIVREDEPSSVVALALACENYQIKVKEFRSHPGHKSNKHDQTKHQASVNDNLSSVDEEVQQKAIEASLLGDTGTHMKYSFAHGSVKASCKIFYAESFDALRRRCGVAERFVESLSRCLKFDSKGGKTKSLFLKTLDNRFIIKSLQEVELKAFTKFAPDYFNFMGHTLFRGVPSVIAKMFGLFQVTIKNPSSGMDFSYYLLVMENLFYERNPNRRFDLKGSMRNRKIESTGQPDEVLLDENLVETIFESPLFVREHARKLLQASVWNDTMFLSKQNVMDYSLMAGFDDDAKELVVGIIDCIRTYTWDKKLESWIKDRGKNKPTITSPKDYRNRFRVSMMQYALMAPSSWHQFQAQMTAPKTLKERDERDDGDDVDMDRGRFERRTEQL